MAAVTFHCEQGVDQAWSCSGTALVGPTGVQGGAAFDPRGPESSGDPHTQQLPEPCPAPGGRGDPPPPELMATISKMGNYWF